MKLDAVRAVSGGAPVQHTLVLDPRSRQADIAAFQDVLHAHAAPRVAHSARPQASQPLTLLQAWSDQLGRNREAVRLSGEETLRARDAVSVLRMSRQVADAGLASDLTAKVIGLTASRLDQLTKLS